MNTTHIVDKLRDFDLNGMVGAIEHHGAAPAFADLPFQDRLMHFLQAEAAYRDDRRLKRILKSARLKIPAAAEDIDYRSARNLDRAHMAELPTCAWVRQAENLILTGATGTGKTHLACAFGGHAARVGLTVRYYRTHQLLGDMAIAHQDGSLGRLRMSLTRFDLLILDDFGLTPLTELGKHDLLDVVDARTRSASILLAGQLSFKEWHAYIAVRLRSPALTSAPVIGCPELCPLHSTSRQLRDELLNEALFRSPRSMLEASGGADLHLRIVSTRCSNPALVRTNGIR